MDATFYSFLLFLITTGIYFGYGRPTPTLSSTNTASDSNTSTGGMVDMVAYEQGLMSGIAMYMVGILVTQLLLNISYLSSKCGFNSGKNIPSAMIFTIIPWVFIFGVLAGFLFVYPHLKSAFSNVIGFFVIAGAADTLLSKMLTATDVVMQNSGILVNSITLENFDHIWPDIAKRISPNNNASPEQIFQWKQELLALVAKKESIGEAAWYVYTAIFVISIVYYNLASKGCIKDPATMKKERDQYIQAQEAKIEERKQTATTYHV